MSKIFLFNISFNVFEGILFIVRIFCPSLDEKIRHSGPNQIEVNFHYCAKVNFVTIILQLQPIFTHTLTSIS